jgi:hypothetical protein
MYWQQPEQLKDTRIMASNSLGSSTAVEKHIGQLETIATSFVVPVLVLFLRPRRLIGLGCLGGRIRICAS